MIESVGIICLIVLFIAIRKCSGFNRKKNLIIFYVLMCIGVVLGVLSWRNFFASHETPEKAYAAYGGGKVFCVIEGEASALVVGEDGDVYVEKSGRKLESTRILSTQGDQLEIVDNRDTIFQSRSKGYGFYEYYGHITELDSSYELLVNGMEFLLND